jgi:ABC-type nitrate/sulfonate/bicarbonate transport system substrate-binding protein
MNLRQYGSKIISDCVRNWLPCLFLATSLHAQSIRVGVISESANNWPLWAADARGFFRDQGLDVKVVVTGEAQHQLRELEAGRLEITHQAADHFVRAVEEGKNFVVFMTISRPIFDLIVRPGIHSYSDLRGKTIALDQLATGYWLLYRKVLERNGLPPGSYVIQADSGGPEQRMAAVRENRAQFTYMNPPASLSAVADGFTLLTTLADHYPEFPGSSGGARRDWTSKNEGTLVKYLRAYIRAVDWLRDPANREAAIALAAHRIKQDSETLPASYDSFVKKGLVPAAAVSPKGFQQVLELLAESKLIKKPLAQIEKYVDASYQQKALASMKN